MEGFGTLNYEAVDHCNWSLTGYHTRSLKDNTTECNEDYGGKTQEISQGNNISNWARDNSCDMVATFLPCTKAPAKANVKSIGVIPLAGEKFKKA